MRPVFESVTDDNGKQQLALYDVKPQRVSQVMGQLDLLVRQAQAIVRGLAASDDVLVKQVLRAAFGDIVFSDAATASTCRVLRVSKETTDQHYFGLNCLHSEVLANNVKCSTFGKYHFIPSPWMSWTGRLIGVERVPDVEMPSLIFWQKPGWSDTSNKQ